MLLWVMTAQMRILNVYYTQPYVWNQPTCQIDLFLNYLSTFKYLFLLELLIKLLILE